MPSGSQLVSSRKVLGLLALASFLGGVSARSIGSSSGNVSAWNSSVSIRLLKVGEPVDGERLAENDLLLPERFGELGCVDTEDADETLGYRLVGVLVVLGEASGVDSV